jgi:hypothetical protein
MAKLIATHNLGDYYTRDIFEDEETHEYSYIEEGIKAIIPKLQMSEIVADSWDVVDLSNPFIEKLEDGTFKASLEIVIYDWISTILYGYGETKEASHKDLMERFNYFNKIHMAYMENLERNKREFYKKTKRFAFVPIDKLEYMNNIINFNNLEFKPLEDNEKSLRDFVVEDGCPDDARADNVVMGYIKDNQIVFFIEFCDFVQKEEALEDFAIEHYKEVLSYYGIKEASLWSGIQYAFEYMSNQDKNSQYLSDDLIDKDYDYCIPKRCLVSL